MLIAFKRKVQIKRNKGNPKDHINSLYKKKEKKETLNKQIAEDEIELEKVKQWNEFIETECISAAFWIEP